MGLKYSPYIISAIIILLTLSVYASAPDEAELTIVVVTPSGSPVSHADIWIYNSTGVEVYHGETGDNGTLLVSLPTGKYTINVTSSYGSSVVSVDLSSSRELRITLPPAAGMGSNQTSDYGESANTPPKTPLSSGSTIPEDEERVETSESKSHSAGTDLIIGVIALIFILLLLVIYSRLRGEKVLENVTRKEILEYIRENPGVHFRAIMKALGVKQGALSHHLDTLEREEYIKSRKEGMYRRYYPADMVIRTEIHLNIPQQKILLCIKEHPGIDIDGIMHRTGLTYRVVYYNTRLLNDLGLIYTRKEGGRVFFYPEAS